MPPFAILRPLFLISLLQEPLTPSGDDASGAVSAHDTLLRRMLEVTRGRALTADSASTPGVLGSPGSVW